MALTYRSPVEEVLALLEPSSQSLIAATATQNLQQSEQELYSWFCYSMPALAKEHLSKAGIYLSPYAGYPHSHPVCKTLENYLLYSVVSNLVNPSFYFVGIKESKLNFLKKRRKNMSTVTAINRYVTSADKIRYGNEFVYYASSEIKGLKRHRELLDSDSLRALVPNVKEGCNLFFHDELHYWSKEDLSTFLEVIKPQCVLATVVFPPDYCRLKRSLNPWCYEYEVHKGRFNFYPDGVRAEGYEQPLNGGYLLKANYIELPNGDVYSVDIVCSKFAHHLVSLTRGRLVTPKRRSFGPFEAIDSKGLRSLDSKGQVFFPVSLNVVSRLYRYLRSLKKPDKQSAMAKFSQLVPDPSGEAIKFVEEFSSLVIGTDTLRTALCADKLTAFFGNLGAALPPAMASRISSARSVCLDQFVFSLRALTVELDLVSLKKGASFFEWDVFNAEPEEHEMDLLCRMDNGWGGQSLERTRSPYVGLLKMGSYRHAIYVDFDVKYFAGRVVALYLDTYAPTHDEIGGTFIQFITKLKACCGLLGHLLLSNLDCRTLKWMKNWAEMQHEVKIQFKRGELSWFLEKRRRSYVHRLCTEEQLDWWGEWECPVLEVHDGVARCDIFGAKEESAGPGFCMFEEVFALSDHEALPTFTVPEIEPNYGFNCCNKVKLRGPFSTIGEHAFMEEVVTQGVGPESMVCQGWERNVGENDASAGTGQKWLDMYLELHRSELSEYDVAVIKNLAEGALVTVRRVLQGQVDEGSVLEVYVLNGEVNLVAKCAGEGLYTLKEGHVLTVEDFQAHEMGIVPTAEGSRVLIVGKMASVGQVGNGTDGESKEVTTEISAELEETGVVITHELKPDVGKVRRHKNPGGGDCFWYALGHFTGLGVQAMRSSLKRAQIGNAKFKEELDKQLVGNAWAQCEAIVAACAHFGLDIHVYDVKQEHMVRYCREGNDGSCMLWCEGWHFEAVEMVEACVLRAISELLGRRIQDVQKVVHGKLGKDFEEWLLSGEGIDSGRLPQIFECFDIKAFVYDGETALVMNEGGTTTGVFELSDKHLSLIKDTLEAKHAITNKRNESLAVEPAELRDLYNISSSVSYKPDEGRGRLLVKCLVEGNTGVLCSSLFNGEGSLYPEQPNLSSVRLHFILGVFGCGKSTLFKKFLIQAVGKSLIYVSPRKALCLDFTKLIGDLKKKRGEGSTKYFSSSTFETALKKADRYRGGSVIILDEIQLFPPGYLDLMLMRIQEECTLFCIGDPCQSDYDNERDRATLGAIPTDVMHVLRDAGYRYNILSHRFRNEDLNGRLPCLMEMKGGLHKKLRLIEGLDCMEELSDVKSVCLVSSFEEKKIVAGFFGSECKCYTFGESTGLTFDRGCLLITAASATASERRWVTALSRFREEIVLVNAGTAAWPLIQLTYAKRVLGRFLCKSSKVDDLIALLPGKPDLVRGFDIEKIGADEGKREDKLAGDPWLKSMINLFQTEDQEEVEVVKEVLEDEWFKTHLPTCEMEGVRSRWVHKILSKEICREKRMGYLVSEQFTDEHSRQLGKQLTNAAERFETIYPRHRAADTVTFIMAVRKRLRFSDPVRENAKLKMAMPYGPFLLKEFLKRIPLKRMHNHREMMASALHDFEEKKTSKSAATIENHSNRSCRDWLADVGMVFSKSQLCTKFDNRFREAKAAQTIVCFQHSVLCRFAPYMRYIEKKLHEVLPKKYYVHSGKGLEELNDWVLKSKFTGVCTESDYEAFDASQDQYIVAFEICLMRYLGLPNDLIEDYKYIKTHLGSKLGNFAIMRFSGEASTFLFNTMANMLFTFLRYDLSSSACICFAGDDMCSNQNLRVSKEHEKFLGKLKLKAKVQKTTNPTFCGWSLTKDGIFKKPQLVYERMCIAKETNNLHNCIDNYAIEVSYAYKLGERVKEYMDEEELEAMYNCVRVIVKNKHLLKSDVSSVFSRGLVE
uniref:RdRp polyprotein replicase n=1 Tax=Potato virus P TaxID=329164 RepID=Q3HM15_9VIRU|nr:RdRp polyprotein replicase [Potato virus P]